MELVSPELLLAVRITHALRVNRALGALHSKVAAGCQLHLLLATKLGCSHLLLVVVAEGCVLAARVVLVRHQRGSTFDEDGASGGVCLVAGGFLAEVLQSRVAE